MIPLRVGDRVGAYCIEERLGQGAHGEVWRAFRDGKGRREFVALKIATDATAVHALATQLRLQSRLEHPGIVRVIDDGLAEERPHVVTECVDGTDLREVIRRRAPLSPNEARHRFVEIATALHYAHDHGVVHGDLKPENILLTANGRVKLTDFGLGAEIRDAENLLSASLRSSDAAIAGTMAYLAPELRDAGGRPEVPADLYALGIILFELLTGKRPAGRELPSQLVAGLPRWCDRIFEGLYTRVDRRFESVAQVLSALAARPPRGVAALRHDADRSHRGHSPLVCEGFGGHRARPASGVIITPLEPPESRLIAIDEACRLLSLSRRELSHYVRRGMLRPVRGCANLRFHSAELFEFRRRWSPVGGNVRPEPRREGTALGRGTGCSRREERRRRRALRRRRRARAIAVDDFYAGRFRRRATRLLPTAEAVNPVPRSVAREVNEVALLHRPNRAREAWSAAAWVPAGFWIRVVAFAIDIWVIAMIDLALHRGIHPRTPGFGLLTMMLYFTLSTGIYGQTFGKLVTGIRVLRVDGHDPTLADAFLRWFSYLLSFIPAALGFFVIGVRRDRRGLHDLICGTRVVHEMPVQRSDSMA